MNKSKPSRKQQVLIMLAQGMNVKSIALALKISPKTVEYYRTMIYQQTGLHCIAELTQFALKNKLITFNKNIP